MAELTSDTAASPERATSSSVENPQLRLVDLDKTYPGGHHALRGVSLDGPTWPRPACPGPRSAAASAWSSSPTSSSPT